MLTPPPTRVKAPTHRRLRLTVFVVAWMAGGAGCLPDSEAPLEAVVGHPHLSGLCSADGRTNAELEEVRPNDWFVLAGSFVHTFDAEICREWERLVAAGYAPRLAWSDVLPSFRPGWIVIVEGPFRPDSAQAVAAEIEAVVPGALAWPGW